MITFQEYMQIVEFLHPAQADISDIELSGDEFGYEYTWTFNDYKYAVYFEKITHPFELPDGTDVEANGYVVEFVGPRGTRPTDLAGGASAIIYKQMMLAIRKLIETQKVDYLAFAGSVGKMDRLYDRFVKTFLGDRFTWYDVGILINNAFLDRIVIKYPRSADQLSKRLTKTKNLRQEKLSFQKKQDDQLRQSKRVGVTQDPVSTPAKSGLFGNKSIIRQPT